MRRLLALLATFLMIGCTFAVAQTSWPANVEVTVTAPSDGGPIECPDPDAADADGECYSLFLDGIFVQHVQEGLTEIPGLIPGEGTYEFQIVAHGPGGDNAWTPVNVTVTEIPPPGEGSIDVQVNCDACTISISQ